jgi:hypothetical protein
MLPSLSRAMRRVAAVVASIGSLASTLDAQPITFYFRGVGTGSLDGQAVTRKDFEFTIHSDISAVGPYQNADFAHFPVNGTIDIAGFGIASFVRPLYVFRYGKILGFGNESEADLIDLIDDSFTSYGLDAGFAPLVNPGVYNNNQFIDVETSLGRLTISEVYDREFEAVVGTTVTPEPGTILLLAAGMGATALIRMRRRV